MKIFNKYKNPVVQKTHQFLKNLILILSSLSLAHQHFKNKSHIYFMLFKLNLQTMDF